VTGKGVQGTLEGRQVAVGNASLMIDLGASIESLRTKAESLQKEGRTVMYIALEGKFAGLLAVADPIKDLTAEAIEQLKREGIKVVMVKLVTDMPIYSWFGCALSRPVLDARGCVPKVSVDFHSERLGLGGIAFAYPRPIKASA
jgi:haloacid dehalogenase-like hydrolase